MWSDVNVSEQGNISSPPLACQGYLNYSTALGTPAVAWAEGRGRGRGVLSQGWAAGGPPMATRRPLAAALMGPLATAPQTQAGEQATPDSGIRLGAM